MPSAESPFSSRPTPPTRSRMATRSAAEPIISTESIPISTPDPTPPSSPAVASGPLASVPSADPTPLSSAAMASGPGTDPGPAAHPVVSASSPSAARGRHRHTEDPRANRLVPLTGGAPIKLESTTVVGRDPDNISDYPGAACVSLNDVTRSISKTHAALALAPGGLWITDLHSTNGTRIEEEGHVTVARPGESIPVPTGATIVLGSAAYRVED